MKKVITYGIFDTLNYGQMDFLRRARELGDYLIVALMTDEYINLQGRSRTALSYEERKRCLESLSYVDEVIPETRRWQKITDHEKYKTDVLAASVDMACAYDYMKQFCEVVCLPKTPEPKCPEPVSISIILENAKNYRGELVYLLRYASLSGMYAMVRAIVDFLAFADAINAKPYIFWEDSLYKEDYPINGTANPFEYYFEPVSDVREENLNEKLVIRSRARDRNYIYSAKLDIPIFCTDFSYDESYFNDDSTYMHRASRILKKYFQFNQPTQQWLDKEIANMLQEKKTLGIHMRGADCRSHQYAHHPIHVTTQDYINAVNNAINEYAFEQVFLATDDFDMLREFQEQFGALVIHYTDVYRSTNGEHLYYEPIARENHKYHMGLEVIRDAETLVRCDGVILGMSQVGLHVKMKKMSLGQRFEPMILLYKGKHPD